MNGLIFTQSDGTTNIVDLRDTSAAEIRYNDNYWKKEGVSGVC